MVWQHGNSFLKSITSSYYFPSVRDIWFTWKLRQPVTKYIETTTFCKGFPSPFFDQCWWVCKLHQHHAADELLTHNTDIGERDGCLNGAIFKFFWEKTPINCVSSICLRIFVTGCLSLKFFFNHKQLNGDSEGISFVMLAVHEQVALMSSSKSKQEQFAMSLHLLCFTILHLVINI